MADKGKEKPRHLGRGLESLMSPIIQAQVGLAHDIAPVTDGSKMPPDKELRESFRRLRLSDISPNPYQPRASWDETELAELAESIKTSGLIQPIVVRPFESGYQLIAGERRFRAAGLAGLDAIPALVRSATDEELLELALVENIHRKDLNPIERGKAYARYIEIFSLTQADAAGRLGEDRSVIANYMRLLDLPTEVQTMLVDGRLSMGHARAILGVANEDLRRKLANRALAQRLSVREVERLVRSVQGGGSKGQGVVVEKAPHIVDLERRLTSALGTKVVIAAEKGGRRGKIVVEFYSLDEFDRITERLGLAAHEAGERI